jgi:hypothetical protein
MKEGNRIIRAARETGILTQEQLQKLIELQDKMSND